MRIRIVQKPTQESIDGLQLDRYEFGCTYDVGTTIGALFLAEGWAEPVAEEVPADAPAAIEAPASMPSDPDNPPNLRREVYPPYLDRLDLDVAADLERLRRADRMHGSRNSGDGDGRRARDPRVK